MPKASGGAGHDLELEELEDDSLWEPEAVRPRMTWDEFVQRVDQVTTQPAI